MNHVRTVTPPPAADPIHAVIACHRAAYDAFQVAPADDAHPEAVAASDALVAARCATRFGALALLEHLRWWTGAEREFAADYQPTYGLAETRAADLTLFLGTNLPPVAIPRAAPCGRLAGQVSHRLLPGVDRHRQNAPSALPNETLPGEEDAWTALAPVRPDTPHVRAPRFADLAGEALAFAALLIVGGYLVGITTLL